MVLSETRDESFQDFFYVTAAIGVLGGPKTVESNAILVKPTCGHKYYQNRYFPELVENINLVKKMFQ